MSPPDTLNFANCRDSEWYKKRTSMERYLIISALIMLVVFLALIIALTVVVKKLNDHEQRKTCFTEGCIHAASSVLQRIDESVNPCDDFYQFACGKYLKNTIIPEDKSSVGTFSEIADVVRDQLKMIIEEPYPESAPKAYRAMKKYYDLCMNETAIEKDEGNSIKAVLKELGGWPLLEGGNWQENSFDWKEIVYKARKIAFGTGYFLSFYIGTDVKNSTRRAIKLEEGYLGLSREFLIKGFNESLVEAYYSYMVDIAVLFGANRNEAMNELNETLNFEIQLAHICLPKEERRNSSALYNPMTVEQLLLKHPSIPWVEYINNVLMIPNITIDENEVIIVAVPNYITKLQALLHQTPKRVLANYIMRRIALSSIGYLPSAFRDRQFQYYKVLTGQSERQARWKGCTGVGTGSMWLASGAAYARKYFKKSAKTHAEEILADIKAQFVEIIKNIDWMDPDTKENALEKAFSMKSYIGYPDELLDDNNIEKFYEKLEFDPESSYLHTMKNLSLFFSDFYNSRLREPINKTEWFTHAYPTIVNAFYNSLENSIEFPAGILQGVFFDSDRPRYMNYGSIGYVMGHEITHGFDDRGRQFNKDGNLEEWWEEETKQAFIKKAQCIIDQYGNYTVAEVDLNLNGINTQGENIADNGGIKEAYLAYQSWVKRNGAEKRLPGLNYSPNQMFWISAANTWCSKQKNELLKLLVTTGYHSPSQFRVLGPFGNNEYFAKDFDCPLGSMMNPEKKCSVW